MFHSIITIGPITEQLWSFMMSEKDEGKRLCHRIVVLGKKLEII